MIKNKVVAALISIMAGLFMTGMLSAILLPAVEGSETITTVLIIALLGTIIGFPIIINRWLQKHTTASESKISEIERKPKVAFAGLGLLCLGILIYGFTISTNRVTDLAYLLGQNAVIGLIWYVVYSGLLGKHLSALQKTFSYFLILASLMIGGNIAAEKQLQEGNQTMARMQDNMLRILEPRESDDGKIALIETDPITPQSQDPNAIMETWLNSYLNEQIENQNDYIIELEAVNFFGLLDGERIRADLDLTESTFILNRTREIIDKYEQLSFDTLYSARDSIQDLNISASEKRSMEDGLNSTLQSGIEAGQKIWELERQRISDSENTLIFLSTTEANWIWEDEQFVFFNTKSLNIFNAYISIFDRTVAEQDQIRESSSQNVKNIYQKYAN
jgi:hypothetical protein